MRKKIISIGLAAFLAFSLSGCQSQDTASTAEYIGIDAAKDAALKDAGIPADSASFSSAGLDSKNGTFFYEINFSDGNTEYLYDIDAMTGVVIEKNVSGEAGTEESETAGTDTGSTVAISPENETTMPAAGNKNQTSQNTSGAPVSQDQAQAIALSHAGIAENDVVYIKTEQDYSDGTTVYEVEFVSSDGTEYNYKICTSDGSVLSYDFDTENILQSQNTAEGLISEEQARDTVLKRVPGASGDDIILRLKEDDGRMEYEGRLIYDNMDYEFKIDAYSGNLTEWEAEQLSR